MSQKYKQLLFHMLIDIFGNGVYFTVANASRGVAVADVGARVHSRWTTGMSNVWNFQILSILLPDFL
jgi:hypothetical protein